MKSLLRIQSRRPSSSLRKLRAKRGEQRREEPQALCESTEARPVSMRSPPDNNNSILNHTHISCRQCRGLTSAASAHRRGGGDSPLITSRRFTGSILMRLGHTEEVLSVEAVAQCIDEDKEDLFALQNAPRLHSTLEAVAEAFVMPTEHVTSRSSQRGRGLGITFLSDSFLPSPKHSAALVSSTWRARPQSLDLGPIRVAVAKKARMRLPMLADEFPWLKEETLPVLERKTDEEASPLHGKSAEAEKDNEDIKSMLPARLDTLLFTTRPPSRWGTTLRRVPLAQRNTRADWLDIFHALSNNGAWTEASSLSRRIEDTTSNRDNAVDAAQCSGIEGAHVALLELIADYKLAACDSPSVVGGPLVPFDEALRIASAEAGGKAGHRLMDKSTKDNNTIMTDGRARHAAEGDLASQSKSLGVLSSALTPQWLRKIRGHYLKMHRLDLYSVLFRACVEAEESIASSSTRRGKEEFSSPGSSPSTNTTTTALGKSNEAPMIVVPSLVADKEHLGFYTVLFGRREATGSKASRWQLVLDSLRWALPRVMAPSPYMCMTSLNQHRLSTFFSLVANVCVFINNDGNEDRRVRQLIACCGDSGVGNCMAHFTLLDAIHASLMKKITITKGGCTPSALRCTSVILTLRHKLTAIQDSKVSTPSDDKASLPAHIPRWIQVCGIDIREVSLISSQIQPLLYRHGEVEEGTVSTANAKDNERRRNSHVNINDKSPSNELLSMPASIIRSPDDHIRFLAKAVSDVVSALLACFQANKAAVTASTATLVKWMAAEVHECTPVSDWRRCAELVAALKPMQAVSIVDHYGVERTCATEHEKNGPELECPGMPRRLLMDYSWACGCGATNTLLSRECWSCEASNRPSPCVSCGASLPSSCSGLKSNTASSTEQLSPRRLNANVNTGLLCNTPCSSCATPHPRSLTLTAANLWACVKCSTLNPEDEPSCTNEKCRATNPSLERHTCGHCKTETIGVRESMCKICGEATPGHDSRLVLCGGCTKLYPLHNNPFCPYCSARSTLTGTKSSSITATDKSVLTIVPHFTWKCGCGAQNSPLAQSCRKCSEKASKGVLSGDASAHATPTYTCPSCLRFIPPVRRRIIPSLPLFHPFECKTCDALHPSAAELFARRSTSCPSCHTIIPLGLKRCGACGSSIDATATRFMPSFANLPWHCHSCGEKNMLATEDAESALRCAKCDVDRINPLLFSEWAAWDCAKCGTERNYGLACRSCQATHGSIPDAEVSLWRCKQCETYSPSWCRSCQKCEVAREPSRRGDAAAKEDVGKHTLKYSPWRCNMCSHSNGPAQIKSCEKCGVRRPEIAACGLCHKSHLQVECSTKSVAEREAGLEAILLEAAERKESTLVDFDASIPSIFDDVFNDSPLIL